MEIVPHVVVSFVGSGADRTRPARLMASRPPERPAPMAVDLHGDLYAPVGATPRGDWRGSFPGFAVVAMGVARWAGGRAAAGLLSVTRVMRAWPRWAVLLLAAVVLRCATFGDPVLHIDEQFYFATARAMIEGAAPYLDVWDRKPIGLFLLYAPAAALGLTVSIWAYQAMALASATATAALIARLAARAGWARGALYAALAYLIWLDLLEGDGGQTPVFYNLPMVAAASLIAPRADDAAHPARRLRDGALALALVGIALQIKYSVVFEGLFFGLWWIVRERRLGRPWWQACALAVPLAALAAAPTLAAWGWYAGHGSSDAFVYANFRSIGARQAGGWAESGGNLGVLLLIVSPLVALATFAARLPRAPGADGALQRWLIAWAIFAGGAVLVFGTWFDHYALPLLVPLCACAAGFVAEHRRAWVAPRLLAVAFAGALALVVGKQIAGDTRAQFAAVARAVGQEGPGCLFVYSGPPMLYAAADRCVPTRYRFPSHLTRPRERGAIGVDQQAEIERVFASRPQIVVIGLPFRGERADLHALAVREVSLGYRLRETLPLGSDRLAIYALR